MDTKINRKEFIRVPDKNYSILRVYMKAEHIFIKVWETRKSTRFETMQGRRAGAQLSFMDDSMPMESLARPSSTLNEWEGSAPFQDVPSNTTSPTPVNRERRVMPSITDRNLPQQNVLRNERAIEDVRALHTNDY